MNLSLEGNKAPDFFLAGSDGKMHSLKDYRGKTLVMYFYPKNNTPGCTKEACAFRAVHGALEARNTVVLGISRNSLASHQRFISENKLPFVLLSDPQNKAIKAYSAWGEKKMFGLPIVGPIRSTVVVGPDGTVRKHWERVEKPEDHPQEVLKYLEQAVAS
ncbi:MAG: peroxiredoxin [Lentisphaerae bacterium GWF2_57_35]|nr:MAG: peroxiredoxin [Lentisphaerae bacterium GWF2_57_35]